MTATRTGGFTLIEFMIVVAIVGILAAIAIPGYSAYRTKARVSEISAALDGLATGAVEYHSTAGFFPNDINDANHVRATFGPFSDTYMTPIAWNQTDAHTGSFEVTLGNLSTDVNGCQLNLDVSFTTAVGYHKTWSGDLDTKYMPRK